MKRTQIICLFLAVLLVLSACNPGSAAVNTDGGGNSDELITAQLSQTPTLTFADVPADAEYADAVAWCKENGLMAGVVNGRFDPDGTLTRAMLATILYRAADSPAVSDTTVFSDVEAGTWYTNAAIWASEQKLIQGYGNNVFGTNDPVTKEHLTVILGRYAGEEPVWTGNAALAVPATRAEVAMALYHYLPAKEEGRAMDKITVSFNGHTYPATLADNPSAEAFAELLKSGPLTIAAYDYGSFEKVGALGTDLPRSDEQITTSPGDIILYQGNQITVYYAENSWNFTRLGRIDDPSGLRKALGSGDVEITFQLTFFEQIPYDGVYPQHEPYGTGIGAMPGRVVWVHDPDCVEWDGSGWWWELGHFDEAAIQSMVNDSIASLPPASLCPRTRWPSTVWELTS